MRQARSHTRTMAIIAAVASTFFTTMALAALVVPHTALAGRAWGGANPEAKLSAAGQEWTFELKSGASQYRPSFIASAVRCADGTSPEIYIFLDGKRVASAVITAATPELRYTPGAHLNASTTHTLKLQYRYGQTCADSVYLNTVGFQGKSGGWGWGYSTEAPSTTAA